MTPEEFRQRAIEQERKRFQFLLELAEASGQNPRVGVNADPVAEKAGLTKEELRSFWPRLVDEGLVKFYASSPSMLSITTSGLKALERATTRPKEKVADFPPVNVMYVENMSHSNVQQGTTNSTQILEIKPETAIHLRDFIEALKATLPTLPLTEEMRGEALADVATVEAQLKSPKPKAAAIKTALGGVNHASSNRAPSRSATTPDES